MRVKWFDTKKKNFHPPSLKHPVLFLSRNFVQHFYSSVKSKKIPLVMRRSSSRSRSGGSQKKEKKGKTVRKRRNDSTRISTPDAVRYHWKKYVQSMYNKGKWKKRSVVREEPSRGDIVVSNSVSEAVRIRYRFVLPPQCVNFTSMIATQKKEHTNKKKGERATYRVRIAMQFTLDKKK